jgi:glycine cleavage system aminomethyltransferase T
VDSLLIPIDIQIDDVVTRNVMVYSVTIKHNRTDGSVYVHRLKEGETTIDDFVCYRQPDGSMLMTERGIVDRDATALERGTRDIRQTWVGTPATVPCAARPCRTTFAF